jgi:hypothetical protein
MSDSHTADEQFSADVPLIIWTTGARYIRLDAYERVARARDQYKLAAEMAQESIVELQRDRDRLQRILNDWGIVA